MATIAFPNAAVETAGFRSTYADDAVHADLTASFAPGNVTRQLQGVERILVMRPNAIGDFMFTLPALHALRHTYPQAHISFLGKAWHAEFMRDRPGPIDDVLVMPAYQGIGSAADARFDDDEKHAAADFISMVREKKFDLALQMYGGGRYSNPFLKNLGAKMTAGLQAADAPPLDRSLRYGRFVNRRLEMLQLVSLVGATPPLLGRELEVTNKDRRSADALIPRITGERIVIVHPGASDVRRRWPTERFAAVADALAAAGATIVLSSSGSEAVLAQEIVSKMRHKVIDPGEKLSLSALCGMLERAVLMVSNDTGPLHLALSIGTPAVGIFWLTNLLESGPLQQHLLYPLLSVQATCPICGMQNLKARCEHDVCFVDDVETEDVLATSLEVFKALT